MNNKQKASAHERKARGEGKKRWRREEALSPGPGSGEEAGQVGEQLSALSSSSSSFSLWARPRLF